MITPAFDLSQDPGYLMLNIRVPYTRTSEFDIYIDGTDFKFYAKPYFLRLSLPGRIVEDGREKAKFDIDKGLFTLRVPKETAGEHFEGLQMLTSLLAPKGSRSAQPLVEDLSAEGCGESAGDDEDEDEEEYDWQVEQEVYKESSEEELKALQKYGFGNQRSGVFVRLQEELSDVTDVKNPDGTTAAERRRARLEAEASAFSADHYLADLFEDDEIKGLLKFRPWWTKLSPSTEQEEEAAVSFTDDEKEQLRKFTNRSYLLDKASRYQVWLSLVDILLAHSYEVRSTEGEHNVESPWTIRKLSGTLCWLETYSSVQDVLVSFGRRVLCYPLYRHYAMVSAAVRDTAKILQSGKACVLKCLLDIHKVFRENDPAYILNDLYITDYCIWIQRVKSRKMAALASTLQKASLQKKDLELELEELEEAATMVAEEEEEEEEEEERAPTPPSPPKEKKTETKKRLVDSEEEEEEPVPSKKHKKEKGKEGVKQKKEKVEEGKKKKGKKERKVETSEDEAAAPLEDDLSDGPSESQMDDSASTDTTVKSAEKPRLDDKSKQKMGKWEVKLQGIKDLIHDKKNRKPDATQKESSLQKLKSLTSKSKEEAAPHSDSSDSSTLHKKAKSKGQDSTPPPPPKVPSSSTSSSSSSSSVTAASSTKGKEDEVAAKEEVLGPKDATGSTNLFEKFLLTCEAKDRAPRRQPVHQPTPEKTSSKPPKLLGKIEKIPKTSKDSPVQKPEPKKTEKTKQSDVSRPGQSYGFNLDSDEKEGEESAAKQRPGEEPRERRERPEETQRPSWERRTPTDDRRKRREESEPRLFMACDDNQETQDPPEGADKSEKGQATLSLGMDLNLDWMTLDDFQKHLNGEDEILSGPPLSPSELRDAVKSGDYMAVKLALNSKEDYNLDQEDVSGMSLSMLAAAGGQDDILRLLIKKGVRVNGRQKNGTTALMHAAEKNFLTTVAILLEAGSYVNAQTISGETALMKACKRGNTDVVRLLLDYGADCNILSKHKNTAMYFAKLSNNLMVCDLIKDHISVLSSVAEDTIRAYFESRLVLLEAVFPLACHRLCEGPDFSLEFCFKSQPQPEGSGILLFIFHANFLNEITARLCGPCSVHAVVLNDKFQLPIFLDSHFIYSFSPVPGINRLFIRLAEAPTAKVKLLICAYRVQLQ